MSEPVQISFEKKLDKRRFQKLAREYKRQTGQDLCEIVKKARRQSITDIRKIKPGKAGKDLRVNLFKLTDYDYILGFCRRKQR